MGNSTLEISLIYLAAALIAVPIARRLGLSAVLGYLLAGALIGPFGLKLVGDQSAVMAFAEYGVVVMLFLIGLELKTDELWQRRGQIFGTGMAQVVVTSAVFTGILFPFFDHFQSALGIGIILSLSSTALVLQLYKEKGWTALEGGQTGFATLLFQDIAVIPILIFLPLLAVPELASEFAAIDAVGTEGHGGHGGDSHGGEGGHGHGEMAPFWLIALSIIGLVLAGHYLVRPAFRFVASSGATELFTIAALAIVIGVTLLMQVIGLSPALGGFLAGVVLAENEYRHEIETDLEPFRGLLLGLFFLTVGAGLDIPLLLEQPLLIAGATVALVTIKAAVAYAIARTKKMSNQSSAIYALSLAQGGEFAFVLKGLAVSLGVLAVGVGDTLIVVVTLSMLLSPFVILLYERAAARKSIQGEEEMDVPDQGDVIIAGYGRVGQIVSRLLRTQGITPVLLDYDANTVELVRGFGNKVFFGDASREDLLRAAGAETAKMLVIAVDNVEKSLEIVDTVQKHFPNLKIVARARNRQHAYGLIRRGILDFERETFVSSLELGVIALERLGKSRMTARRAASKFRAYDEKMILELEKVWGDDGAYGQAVSKGIQALQETLEQDREEDEEDASDADDLTVRGPAPAE